MNRSHEEAVSVCQDKTKSDSDKFKYVRATELKFSPETIKTSLLAHLQLDLSFRG